MRTLMDRVFHRYGMEARIESEAGQQTVKVFFHSINSRSWQNMERAFSPLGEIPGGQYICVFPAAAHVEAGDTVTVGGRAYQVRRVEKMAMTADPVYQWGLCVKKGGDDTWGTAG